MIRMDAEEKAGLDLLVRARNEELAAEGVTLKAPDVLRWLVRRELAARKLEAAPPADEPKARPKAKR